MKEFWTVRKWGYRTTSKTFDSEFEALAYYDKLCMNNENGYHIMLFGSKKTYTNKSTTSFPEAILRDVRKDKMKKSKTNDFGLNWNLR